MSEEVLNRVGQPLCFSATAMMRAERSRRLPTLRFRETIGRRHMTSMDASLPLQVLGALDRSNIDALNNVRERKLGSRVVAIAYDAVNNRVTSASDAGSVKNYNYDTRGNATTVGDLNFAYDHSNQPVTLSGGQARATNMTAI